jgi:hypothetical protein
LERIDVVVCEKLSKLDQKIDERFDKIEKSITNIYQEIENVKTTQKVHSGLVLELRIGGACGFKTGLIQSNV